ncbi:acetylornithine aminotransferase [Phaffia rhodozyma]|uniref:Acetylornithine aminotransferase n=1 Tax=Phaffia rhodozyma TaxID=264483 RepID=A0A0F7STN9_PHARH|nr:acetylornithine aminotransferase [Phaffia rhodozyma]
MLRASVKKACPSFSLRAISHSASRLASASTQPSRAFLKPTHPDHPVPPDVVKFLEAQAEGLLSTYSRPPIVFTHGKGSAIFDTQNREYLDFSAGIAVNALGHADSQIATLLGEQAALLVHSSNVYHNQWAGPCASLLVELTKTHGGLGLTATSTTADSSSAKVFFANSGAEANEGALKFARKFASEQAGEGVEKSDIVCFERAFHGRTMGALSVTPNPKYQAPFAPLIPGVKVGKMNESDGLEDLINERTCGVIVEPIQGEGGIFEAETEWLTKVVNRARQVGAVVIFDEIQCGLFRTGTMWAHSKYPLECQPDIVTMAKPLANGIPIGAIMVRDNVVKAVTVGSHGTTFGGNVLSTRLAHHVLTRLSAPSFLSNLHSTSQTLVDCLSRFPSLFPTLVSQTPTPYDPSPSSPSSAAIRGRGLILGIPFVHPAMPGRFVELCRERGVLLLTAGTDCVRLLPSLNVTIEECKKAVEVMESVGVVMVEEGWSVDGLNKA